MIKGNSFLSSDKRVTHETEQMNWETYIMKFDNIELIGENIHGKYLNSFKRFARET
jgi:hypothetical protein